MAAFKTHNFLPEIFRTDTNQKFLNATLDQLTSEPNFKKVSGYIGRKFAPTYKAGDGYVAESTLERQHYQVEPAVVVNNPQANTTDFYAGYTDLVNKIAYYGGNVSDHSRMFANDAYSYSGKIDLDKFVNFSQYYWLPNGPDAVPISANGVPTEFTWNVHLNANNGTYFFNANTENVGNTDITLAYGGVYKFNVDANAGPFWLQTQPSVSGFDPQRNNVSVRDVFGVVNNGAASGVVTFNVPLHDTQEKYLAMPTKATVDYATSIPYNEIQGISLADFNAKFGGLDGVSGNIHNKTLIFVGDKTDDIYWTAKTTHIDTVDTINETLLFSEDGIHFMQWAAIVPDGTLVLPAMRKSTWVVAVDVDGYISLAPQVTVAIDEKVYIKSGQVNATKQFFVNYYGLYQQVPLITSTLSTLYYQNGSSSTAVGTINLVQPVNETLDPSVTIEGTSSYTSPNGVPFTNGLKVRFDNTATAAYADKTFYVSGVGSSIKLISTEHMVAVERWADSSVVNIEAGSGYAVNDLLTVIGGTFTRAAMIQITGVSSTGAVTSFQVVDSGDYDVMPANPVSVTGSAGVNAKFDLVLQPLAHDYLTVNRGSIDMNAWTRSNRWFHVDVIKFTAEFNGTTFLLDQAATAKRPIIEFQQNTKLFNHGAVAKAPIAILDTLVTSAYTQIETAEAVSESMFIVTIGGETLTLRNGDRVIFSNDQSTIVRNKIYQFNIVDISNNPLVTKYIGRIAEASDALVVAGTAVIAKCNTGVNKEFWYDGTTWQASAMKSTTNQAPLFDAFDSNGISFGDKSYYTNTNFVGTKVFSYKLGTGVNDTVLGFPLSYRSFNNVGDIQFTNDFDTDTFSYLVGPVTHTLPINSGFMHIDNADGTFVIDNGWVVANEKTKQYQLISHVADGTNNVFEVDILPEASTLYPNIKVLINSKQLDATQYGMTQIGVRYAVVIDTKLLAANDSVDILIYSTSVSKLGFYQVPPNLDNNAANANFTTLTLGQMRNHLITLYHNSLNVTGTVPGTSNLRDLNIKPQGGSILKHAAPLLYSELFLIDQQMNFVESIKLAQREYAKFKNKFLELSTQVEIDLTDIPAAADAIIKKINGIKNNTFPWYYSDMVPQGDAKTVLPDYTVLDPRVKTYQLTQIFDATVLSNTAVLIYITRTTNGKTTKSLMAKDQDYTFDLTTPSFTIADTFNLNYNDILSIVEYSNTDGNYVPETPSKLGLFARYVPTKYLDNTYLTPIYVIQGHDGSLTPAFNDYRDDLLLELELRIFNNIKITFTPNMHASHTPGKFRVTEYSLQEYTQVLTNSFLSWAGANRLDFTTNSGFKSNDAWTWNYKNFKDTIDGSFLPGSWRSIFMYYYDTMRPHTHPWEMLGFSAKPTWWQDRYGPAPYTGGNLTLWTDLSLGYIHAGDRAGIDPMYARPGLLNIIPVDDAGNLMSPEKYAVLDFDGSKANASFAVGDIGPAEAAWRKSSDYAYAVQIAMALTKPAEYFGLYANVDRYNMNMELNQYIVSTTSQHLTPTAIAINGDASTGTILRTAGYVNWIAEYLKNMGINDPQTKIKTALKNTSVQLNYKVAGYTDKKFLKVLAEQGSPSSTNNSIVIPDENYNIILNKSVPVDRIVYSAVIIEKSPNGYTVSGYDLNNPYFTIIPSQASNNAYQIKAGKLTGTVYNEYYALLSKISYGYEFTDTQQVVDFLVSYQRFLQSRGFIFIDLDYDLNQKKDWILSAKEFLSWAQQGWAPGNVLVLSPVNDKLRVSSLDSVVDEITNTPTGSKLLDPNFAVIKHTNFTVVRTDNDFSVSSFAGQTIAFADLSLVQYEHVIIFDNTTVFNDIIYSADTGNRQYRLKFIGYKTADWTGALNPPGFIYNSTVVDAWQSGKDYRKGQLVTFKDLYYAALDNVVASVNFDNSVWKQIDSSEIKTGLLPNFANNAKMFETIYDVDNQPYNETTGFYSNGLIGFRERSYLTDLLMEADTQAKFYQGYIKQKGTLNAVTALSSAEINGSPTSINVYEEWALRVGEYGATDSNQYAEVILDDMVITANPVALQFLPLGGAADVGAVSYYPADIYKSSRNNTPSMFDMYETNADKTTLPVAGYPRIDDVDATIFDLANYRDLSSTLSKIGTGYTIWTAKDFTGTWNVYRVSETGVSVVSMSYNLDTVATVTTNGEHKLSEGDVIAIKGFTYTVNDSMTSFDGFYQVYSIVDGNKFTIVLTTGSSTLQKAKVITDTAILFKLVSSRLSTVADIITATPKYGWTSSDNIWVDNASSNGWGVYKRTEPWAYSTTATLNISEYTTGDLFGASIKVNKNGQFLYAAAPSNGSGRVASFVRLSGGAYIENGSWVQHSSYANTSTGVAGFGNALELTDKSLIVAASTSNNHAGQVYVYSITNGTSIEIVQAIASPAHTANVGFGTAMCSSTDGNWLYISEPGSNIVYVYAWDERSITYPVINIAKNTVATYDLGETGLPSDILVTGTDLYIPYVDYIIQPNGFTIEFLTHLDLVNGGLDEDVTISYHSNYKLHSKLDSTLAIDLVAGDNFGSSLACDTLGRTVIVGASAKTVNGQFGAGASYVFDRSVENSIARGTSNNFPVKRSIGSVYRVLLDNVVQLASTEYMLNGNSVQFIGMPAIGSIVSVENNHFTQIAKLVCDIPLINQNLGAAVETCADATSIYTGAPGYSTTSYNSGVVYKFTNPARLYGAITASSVNPTVTNGHGIRINGVDITFTGTSLSSVINTINSRGIPGITASNVDSKLHIVCNNVGIAELSVLPGDGTAFDDLGFVIYPQVQVIKHPSTTDNESFGIAISISEDENTLAVSSAGARAVSKIEIDGYRTQFDDGSTEFSNSVANSGVVYVYDLVSNPSAKADSPSLFEYTQELQAPYMSAGMQFGAAVEIVGKSIFVGVPADPIEVDSGGSVMEFTNPNAYKGWQLVRSQTPQVDYASISKAFIYNKNNSSIISRLDVFDPAKGKILGAADQDLDYKTEQDPAVYNSGTLSVSPEFHWSNAQVGKTWWDTSQIRFIDYEQGDLDYKNKHWGETFPGSVFSVYEWVESDYIPSQYVANGGNGTPKYATNDFYVTHIYVDPSTSIIKTKYYYWVSGKSTVDVNQTNRTNSVLAIQQILANPKDQNIPYIAAIAPNAVSLFNVTSRLVGQAVALHIDHTPVQNTNIIHTEYELVKENSNSLIPQRIIDKLQDSLAGINFAGHAVPDPKLGIADRYGIEIRPRQTMFVDRYTALANFVKYINTVFMQHAIADLCDLSKLKNGEAYPPANTGAYDKVLPTKNELSYIITSSLTDGYKVLVINDSDYDGLWSIYNWTASKATWTLVRIQSYLTSLYFSYVDWYDATYDNSKKPTYTVSTYPLISKLPLVAGDTVFVTDNGSSKFAVYRVNDSLTLDKVGSENGTIQISTTLYDLQAGNMGFDNDNFDTKRFDQNPILETQNVFQSVVSDIFVKDLQIEFNKLFFSLVNYIYTEQPAPDWIFKSSFISVDHNIRALAQYPSYIKDNQTYYEDYINEVKPYRTIIREYLPIQSTTDYLHTGVTDFDLPSYYDETTGTYRSPSGEQYYDATRLATDSNYSDWNNNHTYKVVEIQVSSGGQGYTLVPAVTITGGGGSGATAFATIHYGLIASIVITNPGSGYTSIPTVTVNGNGTGALLVPILRNEFKSNAATSYNTVRSIDTEIKFDRITYTSDVVKWQPNIPYSANLGYSEISSTSQYIWADESVEFIESTTNDIVMFTDPRINWATGRLISDGSLPSSFLIGQIILTAANPGHKIWLDSGSLVAYGGEVYLPVNAAVTTQTTFDSSLYQKLEQGNILLDNNNRMLGYYAPTSGMPGYSLPQLVNGIEYPGVNIKGNPYTENTIQSALTDEFGNFIETGFGGGNIAIPEGYAGGQTIEATYYGTVSSSAIVPYFWVDEFGRVVEGNNSDQIIFNKQAAESAATIAGNQVDSTIASYYKDVLLGTRPEDILIDGGQYYDTFNSHSPEEMVPGRVYETLDIQVLQANTAGFDSNVFTITNVTVQNVGFGYDDAASLALKASQGIDTSNIDTVKVFVNGIAEANLKPELAANGAVLSLTILNGGHSLYFNSNPTITVTGSNVAPVQCTALLSQNTYDLIGWRDFYDMNGKVSYTRINPRWTTKLTQDLLVTDTEIHVENIYVLSYPSIDMNSPGRVFINSELITFYSYDEATHTLTQIRRAAEGTGAPTVHLAGTAVVDAGGDQIIPGTSYVPSVPDVGSPETFIGDNETSVFTTAGITTRYPESVTVQVDGKFVSNFMVTKPANQIIDAPGGVQTFTLNFKAINQSISIVLDGILQLATTYTVNGNQLTLNVAPVAHATIVISFNAVQITFVRLGANPFTPGFIPGAPASGVPIVISAAVEGIWENLALSLQDYGPLNVTLPAGYSPPEFITTPGGVIPGIGDLTPGKIFIEILTDDGHTVNPDPAMIALGFPYKGGIPSNNDLGTVDPAPPGSGIVTDGGGLMASTTKQALFIRGVTGTYSAP